MNLDIDGNTGIKGNKSRTNSKITPSPLWYCAYSLMFNIRKKNHRFNEKIQLIFYFSKIVYKVHQKLY